MYKLNSIIFACGSGRVIDTIAVENIVDRVVIGSSTYGQGVAKRNSSGYFAGIIGCPQPVACRIVGMDDLVAIGELNGVGQIEQVVTDCRDTTVLIVADIAIGIIGKVIARIIDIMITFAVIDCGTISVVRDLSQLVAIIGEVETIHHITNNP